MMQGNWHGPDLLWKLASEYHRETEAYDKTVCTGPIGRDGGILPANGDEMGLIHRHAVSLYNKTLQKAKAAGYTNKEFREAITNVTKSRSEAT